MISPSGTSLLISRKNCVGLSLRNVFHTEQRRFKGLSRRKAESVLETENLNSETAFKFI